MKRGVGGHCTLCVLRWKDLEQEVASFMLHAHVLGHAVRNCLRRAAVAATIIQSNWRRALVEFELGERFLAAEILQAAFRRRMQLKASDGGGAPLSAVASTTPRRPKPFLRAPSVGSARLTLSRSSSLRSFSSHRSLLRQHRDSSGSSRADLSEVSGGGLSEFSGTTAGVDETRPAEAVISIEHLSGGSGGDNPQHPKLRRTSSGVLSSGSGDGLGLYRRRSSGKSASSNLLSEEFQRELQQLRGEAAEITEGDELRPVARDLSTIHGFLGRRRSSSRRNSADSIGPLLGLGLV